MRHARWQALFCAVAADKGIGFAARLMLEIGPNARAMRN
jgi:hypothetical protein